MVEVLRFQHMEAEASLLEAEATWKESCPSPSSAPSSAPSAANPAATPSELEGELSKSYDKMEALIVIQTQRQK